MTHPERARILGDPERFKDYITGDIFGRLKQRIVTHIPSEGESRETLIIRDKREQEQEYDDEIRKQLTLTTKDILLMGLDLLTMDAKDLNPVKLENLLITDIIKKATTKLHERKHGQQNTTNNMERSKRQVHWSVFSHVASTLDDHRQATQYNHNETENGQDKHRKALELLLQAITLVSPTGEEEVHNRSDTLVERMEQHALASTRDDIVRMLSELNRQKREKEHDESDNEHSREKRGVQVAGSLGPLLIAGAAANAIYSIAEGGAPLSWAGATLGTVFGLATQNELQQLALNLQAGNRRLESLELNQDQIVKAIQALNNTVIEFTDLYLNSQGGTALLTTQQDLKEMSRHMTVVVELSLLKYADIHQAAANGKVSPHVFNQKDLDDLAKDQLTNNIKLTNQLDKVKMLLTTQNNEMVVILSIPIEDPEQLYTFYKITPIPIFTTNQTVIPRVDLKYVALAKRQPDYLVLDEDEFDRCVNEPTACTVTSPIRPRNLDAHCAIQSYTTSTNKCPLEEWNNPHSTFIMYKGNTTIYSVGNETTIFVRCNDPHSHERTQDDTVRIKGSGTITLRAGCTASLPDGTKWHTPAIQPTNKMGEDYALFAAHNTLPTDVAYTLKMDPKLSTPPPQIILVQPSQEDLDTAHEFATAAFLDKNTLVPYIMRVLVTIIAIFFMAVMAFFAYKKCRQICGPISWIPCIRPLNDDTDMYMDLHEKIQTLQQQLKLQFQSFKHAMSSRSLATEPAGATEMTDKTKTKTNRRVHYTKTADTDDATDFV